ncbi:hypothetical protein HHI36_015337 [Cryptolaemus montrouzieri]|uniref:Transcription factor Adf-1 n=1 Tax=Cryptolaemus montrouzieri TaxID=559131 RepID=A0ABD2N5D5_9CUCU
MGEHSFFNIKFVSEVEKYPCLYNYTMKEYSKKNITEKAWSEVGKAMNLSPLQSKERWKNLRSVFVRNLKPSPSGTSKKKKYYLTDVMQFAIPYIKLSGTTSNRLPNITKTEEIEIDDPQQTDQNEIQSDSSFTENLSCTLSSIPVTSVQSVSSKRNEVHERKLNEIDERIDEYLKDRMKKVDDSTSNANKMFLLSLLPDLNTMTPTQIRTFKRKVVCLIDDILTQSTSTNTFT